MSPTQLARWPLGLFLAGGVFLAVCASAQDEEALQWATKEPGFLGSSSPCSEAEPLRPDCPRKKKAATLVPSFTKTTVPPTPPPHPTTHRPPTTAHPNMTTPSPTTAHPNMTTHSPTTAHPNMTTHRLTTQHHNMTTHGHPTTHGANHTAAPHHTTAPAPTQPPLVPTGDYVVKSGSATCARLQTGLQLQVRYTARTKQQLWGTFAVQPNHTASSGSCSNHTVTLHLQFHEGFLRFTFLKNETQKVFYLSRVQANLTYQFPQATETTFAADNSSLREFQAHLGHSYQCKNRSLALAGGVHLNALKERVQAFEMKAGDFGEAEVCEEERRSYTLPIVVAVVLVVLILIVVVGYLVGRRRAQGGYQPL